MKAFEPFKSQLNANYNNLIAASQMSVTACLSLEDKPAAVSVFNSFATAVITGGEALSGEATYSGTINMKIMYENEAGGGEHIAYQSNFAGKLQSKELKPDMKLSFDCSVREIKVDGISEEGISVSCILDISAYCEIQNAITYVSDGVGDLYLKKCENTCCTLTSSAKGYYTTSKEIELKEQLKGVLSSCGGGIVNSEAAGLDCAVVQGEFFVDVCYKTGDEPCNSKCVHMSIPFKEEIVINGSRAGQMCVSKLSIKCIKVSAEVDEEKSKSKLRVEVEYCLHCMMYGEETFESVVDCFSLKHNLLAKSERFESHCYEGNLMLSDRINNNVEIEDAEIDKIIGAVQNTARISDCYVSDCQVFVEGIVLTNILYCEGERLKALLVETPFSVSHKAEDCQTLTLSATAAVSGCEIKHKKTKQIELSLELELSVDCFSCSKKEVVTDIEILGERPVCPCSIEVYACEEGESLWDISKKLSASPDDITYQNPQTQFPTKKNDKVLFYRQK